MGIFKCIAFIDPGTLLVTHCAALASVQTRLFSKTGLEWCQVQPLETSAKLWFDR